MRLDYWVEFEEVPTLESGDSFNSFWVWYNPDLVEFDQVFVWEMAMERRGLPVSVYDMQYDNDGGPARNMDGSIKRFQRGLLVTSHMHTVQWVADVMGVIVFELFSLFAEYPELETSKSA